jgi:hypothetical protein
MRKVWNGKIPEYLEAAEAAKYLWGAENFACFGSDTQPYSAGSQDHCGLFFPGINKLNFTGHHWPSTMINLNDPTDPAQAAVFKWLEEHLYIVDIPFVSRPGNYNSQRVNHLMDDAVPHEAKVAMVKALADASEGAWAGITSMDSALLGASLSATMKAWEGMLPYTTDPYLGDDDEKSQQLKDFWTQYDAGGSQGAQGCLFSGAGGGFLMVVSDQPVENGMQIELNHEHYCKPFASDNLDSEAHTVPHCGWE